MQDHSVHIGRFLRLGTVHGWMLLACWGLLAGGCATARHYKGLEMSAEQQASLVTVPAVAQSGSDDCGYAAMASVALYHHVPVERLMQGEVVETYCGPPLSAADLVQMASKLGLSAFGYQGDLPDLQSNVAKGRPVLALLDKPPRLGQYPGFQWYLDMASLPTARSHWVVVTGFAADGSVVLQDPRSGLVAMPQNEFVASWKKRAWVCVLVVAGTPPGGGTVAATPQ